MFKINFLIGLPCSGKSTYLSKLKNVLIIDDPKDFALILICLKTTSYKTIWIADPYFCNSEILEMAITKLKENFDFDFELFYFENNLEKCLKNLERRKKSGDMRKVESFMINMSKIYTIKDKSNILKINN